MSYRIAQDSEYVGKNYWRWCAWIEADGTGLDTVKEVVWILHPSFKRTRVTSTDRSTGFRLETAGWGSFLLRAEIVPTKGKPHMLNHRLRLEYPETTLADAKDTAAAKPTRPPTIFLSYSSEDARTAASVREEFERAGVEVLDTTRIDFGEPWGAAVQRMISRSDAVFGVIGEDDISPFVVDELRAAVASEKPSLALLPKGNDGAALPSSVMRWHFDPVRPNALPITEILHSKKIL